VLGKTFTKDALAALAGSDVEIEPLLTTLARKEVLGVQTDPRSPEHGQYGFLQDLVRHVAYETLSKRERRARHLAAAAHLSTAFAEDEDEVVEVIASHYLAAYEAAPDASDATVDIKSKAQAMLVRAGQRAESLAASAEARRYFEQAAELTADLSARATCLDRAGAMAARAADPDAARRLFEESIALHEQLGDTHAAARVSTRLARVEQFTGRRDEAMERMERAFAVISADDPDEDLALLAARLSFGYWYGGDLERAAERAELALDIAEANAYPAALALALRAKTGIVHSRGHREEASALLKRALEIALVHELDDASTCLFWLSDFCFHRDEYVDAMGYLDEALALNRKRGDRPGEWSVLAERTYPLLMLGRWDEAQTAIDEFTPERIDAGGLLLSMLQSAVEIHVQRGELDEARRVLSLFARLEESTDTQELSSYLGCRARLRRAEGQLREALTDGEAAIDAIRTSGGLSHQAAKQGFVEAAEAALALGESAKVEELVALVEAIPHGTRPPYLDAQAKRFRAQLGGDPSGHTAAAAQFSELNLPFWLAVTLLEHGELTGDESSLSEAREIFEGLKATPWLERLAAAAPRRAEVTA
jgi:tetratricopeptide (TPR) repeat protein